MKIFKKLVNTKDKKRLLENYLSLLLLQGANFILPLISMPYLVRVLGVENYGLVIFAQSIIALFNIFVDFGFNLSATREISINRNNHKTLQEVFSAVMTIKLFFAVLSLLILSFLVYHYDKFNQHITLYYITFGLVLGQAIFPIWFFQGMEKMKYITALNVASKIIFTASIFIFIHNTDDYNLVACLYSFGSLFIGAISLYIIFKKFKIKFILLPLNKYIWYFKDSSSFFLSRVSVAMYTSSSALVLGFIYDSKMVGYYAIAEKLYMALRRIYQPISSVLYPYISKSKNINLYKKIFVSTNILNILLLILLYSFSHEIISLMIGKISPESIGAFKLFLLVAAIVVPSVLIGYPFLGALGYKNYANYSVVIGSIFHIIGLLVLYAVNKVNINNIIILLLFTESIVFLIRVYAIMKHKLWKTYV